MAQVWLPRTVIDVDFYDDAANMTIMCNYVRFYIGVNAKDLADNTPSANNCLYNDFISFCNDQKHGEERLQDWAIPPCTPIMRKLAPPLPKHRVPTLENFFSPPTYYFRLHAVRGNVVPESFVPPSSADPCFTPLLHLSDPRVPDTVLQLLPQCSASMLNIIPQLDPDGVDSCEMPEQVWHTGLHQQLAFTAARDSESILRELYTYTGLVVPPGEPCPHLPIFRGVVILGSEIIGFLTEEINYLGNLLDFGTDSSLKLRKRWLYEITQAVKYLHSRNLTWGDIRPCNILIGKNGSAHVRNFREADCPSCSDTNLEGSKAQDLEAMRNLKMWLQL